MSRDCKNMISKEGEEFILNLNMYLISTGKSEKEIKDFIAEAEDHLRLGEEEGKTVEDIFGNSPEEYAKSVANEMSFSKKDIVEALLMFILGFGTWIFLGAIKNKIITASIMEVIAIPIAYLVTIGLVVSFAKRFAFNDKKFSISLGLLFTLNIGSLVIIKLLGQNMEQSIVINQLFVNIIIVLLFIVSIIVAKKIDMWYLILPFIFYIPFIVENFTNISFGDSITARTISLILCMVLCLVETKRVSKLNN